MTFEDVFMTVKNKVEAGTISSGNGRHEIWKDAVSASLAEAERRADIEFRLALRGNKIIKKSFRHYLSVLNPKCWIRNHSTNFDWDTRLNELLDAGLPFTCISERTAKIWGYEVWIQNHPYASFKLKSTGADDIGVSRSTAARAKEWLDRCIIAEKSGNVR